MHITVTRQFPTLPCLASLNRNEQWILLETFRSRQQIISSFLKTSQLRHCAPSYRLSLLFRLQNVNQSARPTSRCVAVRTGNHVACNKLPRYTSIIYRRCISLQNVHLRSKKPTAMTISWRTNTKLIPQFQFPA